MKKGAYKSCWCLTCDKDFYPLGIMSHRAMHRRRREDCVIEFTNGQVYRYSYSKLEDKV